MIPGHRELASREAAQFKGLLRFFEHRQYKRGLKSAEQILKKSPEHGETLAMKGLFLSNLDRKEEGYECVRKGLKNDLTSHICWHVYGLLYRADKEYEEATKCYRNALKFDKNNMQILRDLALLQIQMRNYEGYAETRDLLLQLNSHNRMFWIGFAIAFQLNGDHDLAIRVLKTYEDSMKIAPPKGDYEHSELLLYRNTLYEESGDLEGALADLDAIEDRVCDPISVLEKRGNLLQKLGQLGKAKATYRRLIDENPECRDYLVGYFACFGFPADVTEDARSKQIVEECALLADHHSRANLLRRFPLDYLHGDAFRTRASAYVRTMLRKGVPSLFVNLKPLYADSERAAIIEDIMLAQQKSLKENSTLVGEDIKEPPTTYLWTQYYLAQHYDRKGDIECALALVNETIAHTPTLVELYMTKARILKHAGDLDGAAEVMNEARQLDLQDRCVISKCTKYLIRSNRIEEAEKTIGLFTRPDIKDPIKDLIDMQCLWFAKETAHGYIRQNKIGRALKRLHQIEKHFDDFTDDQFDFHTYCLRKTTLRSYIRLLKFEDTLYTHPTFVDAAESAIKVTHPGLRCLFDVMFGANDMVTVLSGLV
ncbi:NMDA receptor-regulated protein 1 [Thamnocephalis sphaerospora]|uniref:NMDA receptor-regulated protein 1 n=1 Tax=Thamnocephalis sphaerospora TaxID=78915 RepID=A0A4P9XKN3_9FUNG|nr:NMDA receptor-regulated protein 1 [Thamnocephalis sphaerospora]|eukprot:RKP06374.1 NMDA receptor-regulated protein 1 [Thamnocephalis sphaerospora]